MSGASPGDLASAEIERVILWARVSPPSGADAVPRRSRPPRSESTYSLSGAIRALEARLRAGGGTIEAQLSGLLVCSFASSDAMEAVELGLELLDEADGYDLSIALSLSPTWKDAGVRVGSAFDDSFFLAARAKPGEILVDGSLRDRVPGTYLFTRQVSQGGVRAGSIDRRHPRRAACLASLDELAAPPLVSATRALVEPLSSAMGARGALVVLEGPLGAGAVELVEAARVASGITRSLWLGAASGALATLESLRRALSRSEDASEARARVLDGDILPLRELVGALLALLGDEPAWIILNPLAAIDVASLEVIAALREARPDLSVVARTPIDTPVPAILGASTARFTLPVLRMADAREVVRTILGPATTDDVVRRVATMGGDSTLGCEEAARLLVASGDLVREDGAFVWRTTPRAGVEGVGVEELARARIELVPPEARRLLEISAVLPREASSELVRAVATRDGLAVRAVNEALSVLANERWLATRDEPTLHFVRRVVQTTMPPARVAELNRFVAEAISADPTHRHAIAHFALEGGRDEDARAHARRTGEALAKMGFVHAAARFVGAPSIASSREATSRAPSATRQSGTTMPAIPSAPYSPLAPSSSGATPATEEADLAQTDAAEPEEPRGPDARVLRKALRDHDVAAIERWVEQATLAGADLASIARLRAVIDLLRGDFANAEARIARVGDEAGPKPLLAQAMVALGAGRSADAVRYALRALALSIRRGDARGKSAAYHALAACYRAERRHEDAEALMRIA